MRSDASDAPRSLKDAFKQRAHNARAPSKSAPRLTLRFTDDEMQRLRTAAAGMALSGYIRKCLFAGAAAARKTSGRRPVADQQALARLLGLLGQSTIAQNLGRLAEDARTGCLVLDEPTLAQISEACAHVRLMRDQLVAALGLIETREQ